MPHQRYLYRTDGEHREYLAAWFPLQIALCLASWDVIAGMVLLVRWALA